LAKAGQLHLVSKTYTTARDEIFIKPERCCQDASNRLSISCGPDVHHLSATGGECIAPRRQSRSQSHIVLYMRHWLGCAAKYA
jgi:hypothetical protein